MDITISNTKDEHQSFLKTAMILHVGLVLVWALFPVLSVIPICIFLGLAKVPKKLLYCYFLLLALVPGLINYTKEPYSDLDEYYSYVQMFTDGGFDTIFEISKFDTFFYLVTLVLTKLSFGYKPVFVLFWSTLSYFLLFVAQYNFSKAFADSRRDILMIVVFYTLFIGIDFGMTGHLVRQCVAMGFIMLALAKLSLNEKSYKIYLILAVTSHLSTIVFPAFVVLSRMKHKRAFILILIGSLVALVVGQLNLVEVLVGVLPVGSNNAAVGSLIDKASIYVDKDDGAVSARMMLEMLVYLIGAIVMYTRYVVREQNAATEQKYSIHRFLFVFIMYSLFVFLLRNNVLLLLRFFFALYFLSGFVLYMFFRVRNYLSWVLIILLTVTAPYRFLGSLQSTQFKFISNSFGILTKNVIQMITYEAV